MSPMGNPNPSQQQHGHVAPPTNAPPRIGAPPTPGNVGPTFPGVGGAPILGGHFPGIGGAGAPILGATATGATGFQWGSVYSAKRSRPMDSRDVDIELASKLRRMGDSSGTGSPRDLVASGTPAAHATYPPWADHQTVGGRPGAVAAGPATMFGSFPQERAGWWSGGETTPGAAASGQNSGKNGGGHGAVFGGSAVSSLRRSPDESADEELWSRKRRRMEFSGHGLHQQAAPFGGGGDNFGAAGSSILAAAVLHQQKDQSSASLPGSSSVIINEAVDGHQQAASSSWENDVEKAFSVPGNLQNLLRASVVSDRESDVLAQVLLFCTAARGDHLHGARGKVLHSSIRRNRSLCSIVASNKLGRRGRATASLWHSAFKEVLSPIL